MECFICKIQSNDIIQEKYELEDETSICICPRCDIKLGQIIKICHQCKSFRTLPFNEKTNRFQIIEEKTKLFPEKYVYSCQCRYNYVKNTIDRFDLNKQEIFDLLKYLQLKLDRKK